MLPREKTLVKPEWMHTNTCITRYGLHVKYDRHPTFLPSFPCQWQDKLPDKPKIWTSSQQFTTDRRQRLTVGVTLRAFFCGRSVNMQLRDIAEEARSKDTQRRVVSGNVLYKALERHRRQLLCTTTAPRLQHGFGASSEGVSLRRLFRCHLLSGCCAIRMCHAADGL